MLKLLLERAGREDLRAWAETLKLDRHMRGAGRRVAIGYTISAAIAAAGLLYYLHE
jgi:hypothetical protein